MAFLPGAPLGFLLRKITAASAYGTRQVGKVTRRGKLHQMTLASPYSSRELAAPRKASLPVSITFSALGAGGVFARKIGRLKVPGHSLYFSTRHRSALRKIPNYAIHKNTLEKCRTQVQSTQVWHDESFGLARFAPIHGVRHFFHSVGYAVA